jgi:hypothetical protein
MEASHLPKPALDLKSRAALRDEADRFFATAPDDRIDTADL